MDEQENKKIKELIEKQNNRCPLCEHNLSLKELQNKLEFEGKVYHASCLRNHLEILKKAKEELMPTIKHLPETLEIIGKLESLTDKLGRKLILGVGLLICYFIRYG